MKTLSNFQTRPNLYFLLIAMILLLPLYACNDFTVPSETLTISHEMTHDGMLQSSANETLDAPLTISQSTEEIELIIFAASSMTETLEEISKAYKTISPNVTLLYSFESSGTLARQIQEGAECDIFISAGQLQMDQFNIAANKNNNNNNLNSLDLIEENVSIDLLENKVVLCVPDANPAEITDFDDWADKILTTDLLFSMGNSDVPVGQYTQKIFNYYGINEDILVHNGNLTYGNNVKEVTSQIKEGSVDCGIVYATDAYSSGLRIIDVASPEMCGQVIYPAAVLSSSKYLDDAKAFLEYLQSSDSMVIFENAGFIQVKPN